MLFEQVQRFILAKKKNCGFRCTLRGYNKIKRNKKTMIGRICRHIIILYYSIFSDHFPYSQVTCVRSSRNNAKRKQMLDSKGSELRKEIN